MSKTPDKGAPRAPRRRSAKAGSLSAVRPGIAASVSLAPSAVSSSAVSAPAGSTSAVSAASTPVVSAGSAAGAIGTVGTGPAITEVGPQFSVLRPLTSLFDPARPGKPVVRPNDLLALRVELVNMKVLSGTPPTLSRGPASGGASYIVLHFPPQALAEQVFFQAAVPGTQPPRVPDGAPPPSPPGANENPLPPPIRARIAGESRLVFKVPDGFSVPYRLADVLAACEQLAPSVPGNALPRSQGGLTISAAALSATSLAKLSVSQRGALSSFALRSLSLQAQDGAASPVLLSRVTQAGTSLGLKLTAERVPSLRIKPRPGLPSDAQTAIELPWRLILAPHAGERWRHAAEPVTSPVTQRTELWHSRLVAPSATGKVIEPPRPDPARTLRAVWALTGEGSDPAKPMQSAFITAANLPSTAGSPSPFRATLSDFDRYQITHLSSNFSVSNYVPQPLDTNLMLLSSLGGWLDARGAWDPPGLSVEEWVHRASMGRDHYVRVVYKGFLFPFGHRVALIKVSERKFHNGRAGTTRIDGNPAYLRQRMFIIVRERERTFVDPQLFTTPDLRSMQRQFPFNSVRIVTSVTPDIDPPESAPAAIKAFGQTLFWPCVGGQPFAFRCVATDIDGRRAQFELPLIFMDNTMASPRYLSGGKLLPDYGAAETNAKAASDEWLLNVARADRRVAQFKRQRIALALSLKSGDTSAEVEEMEFGAEFKASASGLQNYSEKLSRPAFYPSMVASRVRIGALAQLSGSEKSNRLVWNLHYLTKGFDAINKGQVFATIESEADMAKLDFSTQGDRSGGFVQPNLKPSALSRLTGPVAGDATQFLEGKLEPTGVFPSSLSDLPLPLLFGCIPLGEVIEAVANLAGSPQKVPKFASEAATQVESFVNGLVRAYEFVRDVGNHSGALAQAAIDVLGGILQDLLDQAVALAQAQVAPVIAAVNQLKTALTNLRSQFDALLLANPDGALPGIDTVPSLAGLPGLIDSVLPKVTALGTAINAATLPSGFKQSALGLVSKAQNILNDFKTLSALIPQGKALYASLDAIVGHPEALADLFGNPGALADKLEDVQAAIGPIRTTLGNFHLLDGAPKQTLLEVLGVVMDVLGGAEQLLELLEMLTGEELVVRFDWNPEIKSWGFEPGKPLFRANDPHGFLIAVEARVKKAGGSAPKVQVVCSLKHFDLVLINPAAFIELNFEKIEFKVDSGAKMSVDVLLSDIKFVGPLSFVEVLKDLIPLDGFSDPPYLDITPQGIDAGFSLPLPNIAVGMFSLTNLSLGAGFTVPFIGQPLSVRFNFCTREQPFHLTVSMFGGGGFFGITIDPHGVQILEASLEFGAAIEIDFGVASGGVSVMAGIYFRMEQDAASLTGYFRLAGHVEVLCIVSASLELYLELRYEFESGKCVGKAQLTIEISVFIFSGSVTISCERKFSGSNGDPTFRQLMGLQPALPLADELALIGSTTDYAWREYVEAFA